MCYIYPILIVILAVSSVYFFHARACLQLPKRGVSAPKLGGAQCCNAAITEKHKMGKSRKNANGDAKRGGGGSKIGRILVNISNI